MVILISFILLISLFSDNKEHFKQKCIRITPLPKGSIIKPTKSNFITDRIGQDYHYPNYITPPGHFGVSSKGNISTLFKNINEFKRDEILKRFNKSFQNKENIILRLNKGKKGIIFITDSIYSMI